MAIRVKATRTEVDVVIREIRAYYQTGKASLKELPGRGGYDEESILAQARQLRAQEPENHWSDTKLRKSRQFAAPREGYSREQLNELCKSLREYRPHFGIAHLGILVTVSWADGRKYLQQQCIEDDWSKAELEAQLKKRFGARRQGGRRRRVEEDAGQLLVQLDEMADTFLRWSEVATTKYEKGGKKRCALDALPESVRKQVRSVNTAMGQLRKVVNRKQKAVRDALRRGAKA